MRGTKASSDSTKGFKKGDSVNIADAFESWGGFRISRGTHSEHRHGGLVVDTGAFTTSKISEEERMDVVRHACPGAGACGGMYT